MLGHWGMWSTPLFPPLPASLQLGVVGPDRVLSMGHIELFDFKLRTYFLKLLNFLKKKCFLNLTVCKQKTVLMLN